LFDWKRQRRGQCVVKKKQKKKKMTVRSGIRRNGMSGGKGEERSVVGGNVKAGVRVRGMRMFEKPKTRETGKKKSEKQQEERLRSRALTGEWK